MPQNYLDCFNSFMIDASASGFTPQSIRLYRSLSVSSSMSRSSKFAIWENPSDMLKQGMDSYWIYRHPSEWHNSQMAMQDTLCRQFIDFSYFRRGPTFASYSPSYLRIHMYGYFVSSLGTIRFLLYGQIDDCYGTAEDAYRSYRFDMLVLLSCGRRWQEPIFRGPQLNKQRITSHVTICE